MVQCPENFPKRWFSKLDGDFIIKVESLTSEELEKAVLSAEGIISDTEKEMADDEKLTVLKEDVKLLSSGYKEVINAEKAKTKYCLHVMRLRGLR